MMIIVEGVKGGSGKTSITMSLFAIMYNVLADFELMNAYATLALLPPSELGKRIHGIAEAMRGGGVDILDASIKYCCSATPRETRRGELVPARDMTSPIDVPPATKDELASFISELVEKTSTDIVNVPAFSDPYTLIPSIFAEMKGDIKKIIVLEPSSSLVPAFHAMTLGSMGEEWRRYVAAVVVNKVHQQRMRIVGEFVRKVVVAAGGRDGDVRNAYVATDPPIFLLPFVPSFPRFKTITADGDVYICNPFYEAVMMHHATVMGGVPCDSAEKVVKRFIASPDSSTVEGMWASGIVSLARLLKG